MYVCVGFPHGTNDKESTCQCRRHKKLGFDPWIRKIPWRRRWQPFQYSCQEIPWAEEPGGLHFPWSDKASNMTEQLNTHTF